VYDIANDESQQRGQSEVFLSPELEIVFGHELHTRRESEASHRKRRVGNKSFDFIF
jgi:hypothetical protein